MRIANGSTERAEMYELERQLVPSQAVLLPPDGEALLGSVAPLTCQLVGHPVRRKTARVVRVGLVKCTSVCRD